MAIELERLIGQLARDLRPVRRLRAPWLRSLAWLGGCAAAAGLLFLFGAHWRSSHGGEGLGEALAFAGSVATAVCAAVAALSLAVPGRSRLWALLPGPPLLLWLGASGMACWTGAAGAEGPPPMACFRFIVVVSLPLAGALFVMLRRACCVHPGLAATLAGLASATAAAALLELSDAHGMGLADMAAHFGAVLLVTSACRLVLPRALS